MHREDIANFEDRLMKSQLTVDTKSGFHADFYSPDYLLTKAKKGLQRRSLDSSSPSGINLNGDNPYNIRTFV
jgi:hypothetical protein